MHNNMVNVRALQDIYQENHESVTKFAARLKRSASICNFKVTCIWSQDISFSEKIQMVQSIKGLKDTEIQESLLTDTASKELTLSDVIKSSKAIASGEHSSIKHIEWI